MSSTTELDAPPQVADAASETVRQRPSSERQSGGKRLPQWRRLLVVASTVGVQFGVTLMQTVQAVLLARMLSPTGRGEFATAVLYTYALAFIGMLGTQFSIARRAATMRHDLAALERTGFRVGFFTGTLTMLVVATLAFVAVPSEKHYLAPLCMACGIGLLFEHSRLGMLAVDHGGADFLRYNIAQLCSAAILPALLLIAWLSGIHADARLALLTIPTYFLAWVIRCGMGRSRNLLRAGTPSAATVLREGLPFSLSVATSDIIGRLDGLLMLWLADLTLQGLYAVAVPAAGVVAVAPMALALFSFNAGARPDAHYSRRHLALVAAGVVGVQAIAALVLAFAARPLVLLVFREPFLGALPFLYLLLPAQALQGCVLVADGYLRGRNRPAYGIRARILGAIVMLTFVLLAFRYCGAVSVPLGATVGSLVAAIWMARALWKEVGVSSATAASSMRGESR